MFIIFRVPSGTPVISLCAPIICFLILFVLEADGLDRWAGTNPGVGGGLRRCTGLELAFNLDALYNTDETSLGH
jgi:hypothetical protein